MVAVSNDVIDETIRSSEFDPERVAESRETLNFLLSQLPRDERRAVELFCLRGLPLLDASLEMRTSPRRVRQLVADAESRLRRSGRRVSHDSTQASNRARAGRLNRRERRHRAIRPAHDFTVPAT